MISAKIVYFKVVSLEGVSGLKKRIGFTLQPEVVKQVKALIDPNKYSKIIRSFFHGQYELPTNIRELSIFKEVKTVMEPIRLDQDTINLLDEYVKQAKQKGIKANRSLIMRHSFSELVKYLSENESFIRTKKKRVSFYFPRGTSEALYRYISRTDRNIVINQYISQEYRPSTNIDDLKKRPHETESFSVEMQVETFDKLDQFVEDIGVKGVTRTALMRDAVAQLITKLSNTKANQIIIEQRLIAAIRDYEETYGKTKLRKKLSEYL